MICFVIFSIEFFQEQREKWAAIKPNKNSIHNVDENGDVDHDYMVYYCKLYVNESILSIYFILKNHLVLGTLKILSDFLLFLLLTVSEIMVASTKYPIKIYCKFFFVVKCQLQFFLIIGVNYLQKEERHRAH